MNTREIPINSAESQLYRELADGVHAVGDRGTLAFCVSTSDLSEGKGDVFVALGLGKYLQRLGWGVRLWPADRWDDEFPPVDVAVSMLESFVPGHVPASTALVAWVRNWTESWAALPYLAEFDEIWASSRSSAERLGAEFAGEVRLLPIAVDPELFVDAREPSADLVVTTANFWGAERDLIAAIDGLPDDQPIDWYGVNGELLPESRNVRHHGPVDYFGVPRVYASAVAVIDDLIPPARRFGTQNSRLFESLASGALPIVNSTAGLDELGLGRIPTWRDAATLDEAIAFARSPRGRDIARELRSTVLDHHTFGHRADVVDGPLGVLRDAAPRRDRSALLRWATSQQFRLQEVTRERDLFFEDASAVGAERNRLQEEIAGLRGQLVAKEREVETARAHLAQIRSMLPFRVLRALRRSVLALRSTFSSLGNGHRSTSE